MNPLFAMWLKDRGVNLIIYGTIILSIAFVLYKLFLAPSTEIKVGHGGTYNAAPEGLKPTFGCASGGQFLGWAHKK